MNEHRAAGAGMLLVLCLTAVTGTAQTYSVLQNLSGYPTAGLTLSGATLYGTIPGPNAGNVFKINTDGTVYTQLVSFGMSEGSPRAGLALSGSTLYGTTAGAENPNNLYRYYYGVVFKVNTDGSSYTVLRRFSGGDGAYPKARLVCSGETLFGTTSFGPVITNGGTTYYGYGTLFKINTDGNGFAKLTNFPPNVSNPLGGLVLSGTTLYGTTPNAIFKVSTDGTGFTVLQTMSGLSGDLVLSGTTLYGTSANDGVFKINTDGTGYNLLKSVNSQAGLVLSGQTLYGTAASGGLSNAGTIFRLNTDGSHFGVLKDFTGGDGSAPMAPVVFSGDTLCGTLYGTTLDGGTLGGGVVFSLSLAPPSILTPPASRGVATGTTAEFSVAAGGSAPLEYQWLFNATNSILGATNSVLQLANPKPSWSGAYSVVVANSCGSVTSSVAMLSVTDASPIIVASPINQVARLGATADFYVVATGVSPLSYQWRFNATNSLAGETNAALHLAGLTLSQAGAYTVTVTNLLGAVTSSPAILTVIVPGGVVTNCTEADLRAAMAWGGTVTFACTGTITLSNVITFAFDTVLDASGQHVTISGGNAVRVFYVSTNISLTLVNLTIANGRSEKGGALLNEGSVCATGCIFSGNVVSNGHSELEGSGGAIYNAGTFQASRCTFLQNQAQGYLPQPVPDRAYAYGGAICNVGVLGIDTSVFARNEAIGLYGVNGSDAYGGGSGGRGGMGGSGYGGALYNTGLAALANSTIVSNTCIGGSGGYGGEGPYTMSGRDRYYYGPGGNGGSGGSGLGSGIYSVGYPVKLTNCTVALNSATAGIGGYGGGGSPMGVAGANGTAGGAIQSDANSLLVNDILAANSPSNCSGTLTDAGHNLSSDGSSAFAGVGSLNNTDPKLGPLADNGGPTLTMALLAGSPAIDAGDNAVAPATDQRGWPRPYGAAADIGAYEVGPPALRLSLPQTGGVDILVYGAYGQSCRLLASATFSNWQVISTNPLGTNGPVLIHDDGGGEKLRFYRVVIP